MVERLTNPLQERDLPLGTLMSTAGARLAARLDAGLRDAGFPDLRAAHAAPFMVLDVEGARASQLAARARMTKQAMGELVAYLVERGYLETVADPSDGRARLVRATARGREAVDAGVRVIAAFDEWLEERLGPEGVPLLRRSLHLILEAEIRDVPGHRTGGGAEFGRMPSRKSEPGRFGSYARSMTSFEGWVRHSAYSDPGRHRRLLAGLPADVPAVCAAARNVIGHYRFEFDALPETRRDEVDSRWLARILEVDQERHPQPLTRPRPSRDKVAGCCRDHTLFVVGALREHGIAARSRVGFAGYFTPGFWHDHVVAEYRDGDRWVRTDPELPDGDALGFDARDMPAGSGAPFTTAGEVWRAHRAGELDADSYGVAPDLEWRGADFVARYVVYEVAHRFGDELLLWDDWRGTVHPDPVWLDHLAELLAAADAGSAGAEAHLAALHAEDPRLSPGPTVVQHSPFGEPPQTVVLVPR